MLTAAKNGYEKSSERLPWRAAQKPAPALPTCWRPLPKVRQTVGTRDLTPLRIPAGFKSFLRAHPSGRQYQEPVRLRIFSVGHSHPPTGATALHQKCPSHRTCCVICKRSHPKCHSDGTDRQRALQPRLAANRNNLFFGESATFHSCAPMSGTLTFQWHTFRGGRSMAQIYRATEKGLTNFFVSP